MSKHFKFLVVLFLVAGLLLSFGSLNKAEAVKIYGSSGSSTFGLNYCGGSCYYLGAYEYYGNQQVIAGLNSYSPYSGSENPVLTYFQPGFNYSQGTSIAIRLKNAKFIAPTYVTNGASYCLVDSTNNTVVATQAPTSYPTDTLNFVVGSSGLSSNQQYALAICNTNGFVANNSQVQIDPNLGADCNTPAKVQIEWVSGNDCCTADLIYISPKGKKSLALNFTAELDTDRDFKTFLGGNDQLDLCCIGGGDCNCASGKCVSKKDTQPSGPTCPDLYVLGQPYNPSVDNVVKVAFDIVSENAEPGVDRIYAQGSNLTCTTTDKKTWHCSSDCIPCPDCGNSGFNMYLELNGTQENVPTVWSIANASIQEYCFPDQRVKAMCCSVNEGPAGAWFGGVEAIVPFVKKDATSDTYIKLFNRYSKDAKVYAEVFNKNSNKVIVALNQIATIPAGGQITLSGSDFQTLCPTCDWSFGQPVKFLIRVPSQTGCMSASGTITFDYTQNKGTYTGTNCYNNANDPYIEGIVVSVMNGQQRSVPLLFKFFKQGSYNQ